MLDLKKEFDKALKNILAASENLLKIAWKITETSVLFIS